MSSRDESANQVDMVERKEQSDLENTQQSCLVKDGVKKKFTEYKRNADVEKLFFVIMAFQQTNQVMRKNQ